MTSGRPSYSSHRFWNLHVKLEKKYHSANISDNIVYYIGITTVICVPYCVSR